MRTLRSQQVTAARCAWMPLLLAAIAGCLPPHQAGVAEPRTSHVVDASDSRARDAGTDATRKWSTRRGRLLRVWVEPGPRIEGWSGAHSAAVERATAVWSVGAPIRLVRVSQRELADIVISWMPNAPGRIRGITQRWVDRSGDIVRAHIWIALQGRGERAASAPHVIQAIALHELGHALGLGHSDDPEDIMYHDLYARELSAMDRSRLSLLYDSATGQSPRLAGPPRQATAPARRGDDGAR